jgi:uncharacterized protein YdeI (YjbR/CyaY-like superfamily)
MTEHKGLPVLGFATHQNWGAWLDRNGKTSPGLWLKLAKKGTGVSSVSKTEAIEVAIAHGWIDGQLDKYDERFWLIRFTRRGSKSGWSRINRATAIKLIKQGRMKSPGLREVDLAKSDGRWDAAYPSQSKAVVPKDLAAALKAEPTAKTFFATLTGANRYAVLYRINTAKTAKTRAARIVKFVEMMTREETIHGSKK